MESVLRGAVVYLFVWVIIRIAGKRTMAEATTFDLVLLLIISETTQQAMIDSDHSVTNAFLLIITLVGIDILISLFKQRSSTLEKFMDGVPLVVLENGKLLKERMDKVRVTNRTSSPKRGRRMGWKGWTRSSMPCSNVTAVSA